MAALLTAALGLTTAACGSGSGGSGAATSTASSSAAASAALQGLTATGAVDAATLEVEVPVDPDELVPHAARVVSPRAAIRATAVRAAGRLGRTGEDFRSGRAGVEVPQGKSQSL